MSGITQVRTDLNKLLDELKVGQEKMAAGPLSESEGTALEAKAKEAERLQAQLDQFVRLDAIQAKGREIPDIPLPQSGKARDGEAKDDHALGGYMTLGDYLVASKAYQEAKDRNFPAAAVGGTINAPRVDLKTGLVALTKADVREMQAKAVPTLGSGVIDPQRIADVPRVTELDALTLLDLIPTAPTSSNAIEFVRIDSFTRAADIVADGDPKPEATLAASVVNKPVRTFANIMPVTEQQLADAPAIIQECNTHLVYDVRKAVEEQLAYGSGTGSDFSGFFVDAGVVAGRGESGDTLIDKIRRAITDVRVDNYAPNGVAIHPYDWENIVLEKGSDNRYVWVVVTDENGSRLWGLRVAESVGCEETALASFPERNILVGDFTRGATLYIREGVQLALGYNDDDFSKNKRTIRAEMRAAFALKRPKAFRKILTHTASGAS